MSFVRNLFSSPSTPQAPDPAALASAQGSANESTARLNAKLNRVNTYTPFGSVTYTDMGNDNWKADQTLAPSGQRQLDSSNLIAEGVLDAANKKLASVPTDAVSFDGLPSYVSGVDFSTLGDMPTGDSFNTYADDARTAAFDRAMNLLNPQFDQERQSLEQRLANQGIMPGSDAYTTMIDNFSRRKNEARLAASQDAILTGDSLRNNMLSNALMVRQQGGSEMLTNANMQNAARAQGISEILTKRGTDINELAALIQGAPALSTPSAPAPAQIGVAPPDIIGAQGLNSSINASNYNAAMGQQNSALGGLAALGAAYVGA